MCIENALDTEIEVTCIFGNEITQLLKISILRLTSQLFVFRLQSTIYEKNSI